MFKAKVVSEKYLIFQRSFPSGEMFQGAAKPSSQAEAQISPDKKAELRQAKANAAQTRREVMEKAPQVADRILEDIFGHNDDIVKQELGPKYNQIIANLGTLKPGEKYLKSIMKADGSIQITLKLDGQQVNMRIEDVLFISTKELNRLYPLITLKKENPEAKADKYILAQIMDLIFAFKPDTVPDTLEVEEVLQTPLIAKVRKVLVEGYEKGLSYEITTTNHGFKLESDDSQSPIHKFNLEDFWANFAVNENSSAKADINLDTDKTAALDAEWAGKRAEDMDIDDVETLLLGDAKRGIKGRTIGEIEDIYGEIPYVMLDALIGNAKDQYFSEALKMSEQIGNYHPEGVAPEEISNVRKDLALAEIARVGREFPDAGKWAELRMQLDSYDTSHNPDKKIEFRLQSEADKLRKKLKKGSLKDAAAFHVISNLTSWTY